MCPSSKRFLCPSKPAQCSDVCFLYQTVIQKIPFLTQFLMSPTVLQALQLVYISQSFTRGAACLRMCAFQQQSQIESVQPVIFDCKQVAKEAACGAGKFLRGIFHCVFCN